MARAGQVLVEALAIHVDRVAVAAIAVAVQHALGAERDDRPRSERHAAGAAQQVLGIVGDDAADEAVVAAIGQCGDGIGRILMKGRNGVATGPRLRQMLGRTTRATRGPRRGPARSCLPSWARGARECDTTEPPPRSTRASARRSRIADRLAGQHRQRKRQAAIVIELDTAAAGRPTASSQSNRAQTAAE